jgi:hypothetical protein
MKALFKLVFVYLLFVAFSFAAEVPAQHVSESIVPGRGTERSSSARATVPGAIHNSAKDVAELTLLEAARQQLPSWTREANSTVQETNRLQVPLSFVELIAQQIPSAFSEEDLAKESTVARTPATFVEEAAQQLAR